MSDIETLANRRQQKAKTQAEQRSVATDAAVIAANEAADIADKSIVNELREINHVLDQRNADAALSLITQYDEDPDDLTDRQWQYLRSLWQQARKRMSMTLCPHCGGSGMLLRSLIANAGERGWLIHNRDGGG
jgi:hypothetical protein